MTDLNRRQSAGALAGRSLSLAVALAASLGLAACQTNGANAPTASAGFASGAPRSIAFESIDGPPEPVFNKLVSNLSTEASARQMNVVSRSSEAAYRVRGYLAASVEGGKGSVDWVWDVFDKDRERVLRVAGAETVGRTADPKGADIWNNLDDAALQRIATQSLDEIGTRLANGRPAATRPAVDVAPATQEGPEIRTDDGPQVATAPTGEEALPAGASPTAGASALTFAAHP